MAAVRASITPSAKIFAATGRTRALVNSLRAGGPCRPPARARARGRCPRDTRTRRRQEALPLGLAVGREGHAPALGPAPRVGFVHRGDAVAVEQGERAAQPGEVLLGAWARERACRPAAARPRAACPWARPRHRARCGRSAGSGVAAVTPASSRAFELAQLEWPSAALRRTGPIGHDRVEHLLGRVGVRERRERPAAAHDPGLLVRGRAGASPSRGSPPSWRGR